MLTIFWDKHLSTPYYHSASVYPVEFGEIPLVSIVSENPVVSRASVRRRTAFEHIIHLFSVLYKKTCPVYFLRMSWLLELVLS